MPHVRVSSRFPLVAGLVAVAVIAATAPARADALSEVRAAYGECRASKIESKGHETRYFADYRSGEPEWVPALPVDGEIYSEVTFHGPPDGALMALRFDTGPSGDWTKTHEYCFRVDGTLAFILAELRTFNGNVRVEDRFYFAPSGRQFRKLRYVFDLQSSKRLADDHKNFFDRETTVYPTRDALRREVAAGVPDLAGTTPSRAFGDYPVTETDVPDTIAVDMDDPRIAGLRPAYADLLSKAGGQVPNFAGVYVLVEIGCGTACQSIVLVDRRSGRIVTAPVSATAGTTFRRDSRLLVFNRDETLGLESSGFELDDGAFRKVW